MYRTVILRSLALAVPVLAAACATSLETADPDPPNQPYGELVNIGNGTARTYVTWTDEDDGTKSPNAIGIELTADAFEGLPKQLTDGGWCHVAEDGAIRCLPGHEFVLSLPEAAAVPPYQWVLLNWNPQGHIPPGVYNHPHFDFHFYTMGQEKREEIRPGVCPESPPGIVIDCESLKRGQVPLAPELMPEGYADVGATEAGMGNHLLDLEDSGFQGAFTHTFIYGTFDGELTFLEPMITRDFLLGRPDECVELSRPQKFATPGWYPTEYCIRYRAESDSYTVSLENLVHSGG